MIKPHIRSGKSYSGMTVGLLGGSFNPAHEGHLAMSLQALKQLDLDQVWWLVSKQNPLKPVKGMAPLAQRLEKAQEIAAHPRIAVTALESEMHTCYTVDTLKALMRRFPNVRFVWLMGADNLLQIPRWRDWQEIFHLVPVVVFRRPSYHVGRGLGRAALRFGHAWHPVSQAKRVARMDKSRLPAWIILDNKLNYISATQIRKDHPKWQA